MLQLSLIHILISDTFGAYSSGLVSPLVVDLVGKDHFGEAEGFTNGVNEVINIAAQFVGSALPVSYTHLMIQELILSKP